MATIPIYYGFNVNDNVPIDSRYSYANETQRLGVLVSQAYEGLITFQIDTNEVWVLTNASDPSIAANWTKVGNVEFGTASGEVATWAEGDNTDVIPSNKLPAQANFSDVQSYATIALRNAATDVIWHQGDVALVTSDPIVANDGLYFYTGTDQLVAAATNDTDYTKLNIAGTDLTQTVDATSYTINSSTGDNLLLSNATSTTPGLMSAADNVRLNASEFILATATEKAIPNGFVVINGLNEDFWVNISGSILFVTTDGFSVVAGGTKVAFDTDNTSWRLITDRSTDWILMLEADTDYLVKDGQVAVESIDRMFVNRSGHDITVQRDHDFGTDDFEDNTTWIRVAGERLPTQSAATNGQFLQSGGAPDSEVWADVDSLPTPRVNGSFLQSGDGTDANPDTWRAINQVSDVAAGDANRVLQVNSDGTAYDWQEFLPAQGSDEVLNTNGLYLRSTGVFGNEQWTTATGGVDAHVIPATEPVVIANRVNVAPGEFAYVSSGEWYINISTSSVLNAYLTGSTPVDFTDATTWLRLGQDTDTNNSERVGVVQLIATDLPVPSGHLAIADATQTLIYKNISTGSINAKIGDTFTDSLWLKVVDASNVDLTTSTDFGTAAASDVTLGVLDNDTTVNGNNVSITSNDDITLTSGTDTGDNIELMGDVNIDGTLNFRDGAGDVNRILETNSATRNITIYQPIDFRAEPSINVNIDGGDIDGTTVGTTNPSTGAFTTLTANSATLTTADINGGTIDGTVFTGNDDITSDDIINAHLLNSTTSNPHARAKIANKVYVDAHVAGVKTVLDHNASTVAGIDANAISGINIHPVNSDFLVYSSTQFFIDAGTFLTAQALQAQLQDGAPADAANAETMSFHFNDTNGNEKYITLKGVWNDVIVIGNYDSSSNTLAPFAIGTGILITATEVEFGSDPALAQVVVTSATNVAFANPLVLQSIFQDVYDDLTKLLPVRTSVSTANENKSLRINNSGQWDLVDAITVYNGTDQLTGAATELHFVGSGVSATNDTDNNGIKTITIAGGGGGSFDTHVFPADADAADVTVGVGEVLYYSSTEWYVNTSSASIVVAFEYDITLAVNSVNWRRYSEASPLTFTQIGNVGVSIAPGVFAYVDENEWYQNVSSATQSSVTVSTDFEALDGDSVAIWRRLGSVGTVQLQQEGVNVANNSTINFRGGDAIVVEDGANDISIVSVNAIPISQRESFKFTWPATAIRTNVNAPSGNIQLRLHFPQNYRDTANNNYSFAVDGTTYTWSSDTDGAAAGDPSIIGYATNMAAANTNWTLTDGIPANTPASDIDAAPNNGSNPFNLISNIGFDLDNATYRTQWENQTDRDVIYYTFHGFPAADFTLLGSDTEARSDWVVINGVKGSNGDITIDQPSSDDLVENSQDFVKAIFEKYLGAASLNGEIESDFALAFADAYGLNSDQYLPPGVTDTGAYTIAFPCTGNATMDLKQSSGIEIVRIVGTTPVTGFTLTVSCKLEPSRVVTRPFTHLTQGSNSYLSSFASGINAFDGYGLKGLVGSRYIDVDSGFLTVPPLTSFQYAEVNDNPQGGTVGPVIIRTAMPQPVTTKTRVDVVDEDGNTITGYTKDYNVDLASDENYEEVIGDIATSINALSGYTASRDGREVTVIVDDPGYYDSDLWNVTIDNTPGLPDYDNFLPAGFEGNIGNPTKSIVIEGYDNYVYPNVLVDNPSRDVTAELSSLEVFGEVYTISSVSLSSDNTFTGTNIFTKTTTSKSSDNNNVHFLAENNNSSKTDHWVGLEIYDNDSSAAINNRGGDIQWFTNSETGGGSNGNKNQTPSARIHVSDLALGYRDGDDLQDQDPTGFLQVQVPVKSSDGTDLSDYRFHEHFLDIRNAQGQFRVLTPGLPDTVTSIMGESLVKSAAGDGDSIPLLLTSQNHIVVADDVIGSIRAEAKKSSAITTIRNFAGIDFIADNAGDDDNFAKGYVNILASNGTEDTDGNAVEVIVADFKDSEINLRQSTGITGTLAVSGITQLSNDVVIQADIPELLIKDTGTGTGSIADIIFEQNISDVDIQLAKITALHSPGFADNGALRFNLWDNISSVERQLLQLTPVNAIIGPIADSAIPWAHIGNASAEFGGSTTFSVSIDQKVNKTNLANHDAVVSNQVQSNFLDESDNIINTTHLTYYDELEYEQSATRWWTQNRVSHQHSHRNLINGGGSKETVYLTDPFRLSMGKPLRLSNQNADPTDALDGDVYYNSTTDAIRARVNGAWANIGSGGGGDVSLAGANVFTGSNSFTKATAPGVISLERTTALTEAGDVGHIEFTNNGVVFAEIEGRVNNSETTTGAINLSIRNATDPLNITQDLIVGVTNNAIFLNRPLDLESLPSDPDLTSQGLIYYRTSDDVIRLRTGAGWTTVGGGDVFLGELEEFRGTNTADTIDYIAKLVITGPGTTEGNVAYRIDLQRVNRTAAVWTAERALDGINQTSADATLNAANTAFDQFDTVAEIEAASLTWATF